MELAVVHYHYRPGGVRRVIEMALPALVGEASRAGFDSLVLLGGELPDKAWLDNLRTLLPGVPLRLAIDPSLGYLVDLSKNKRVDAAQRIRRFVERELAHFGPKDCLWAHNLSLGRNPHLTKELGGFAAKQGSRLVLHHHDWWLDNRWVRLTEMREAGVRGPGEVAKALFPNAGPVFHACINNRDARLVARKGGAPVECLPNPVQRVPRPAAASVDEAKRWLAKRTGHAGPVWLAPCRLLRRKNLAEGLLLTRWLRPCAALVSTAGVSSADEEAYAARLKQEARRQGWPLHLSVLASAPSGSPSVEALCHASEALVFSSLQEGFGLPFIEAAAHGIPLLGRRLQNVLPDLEKLGFEFPQLYDEIWIDSSLYDHPAEQTRIRGCHGKWREQLPMEYRRLAQTPAWSCERGGRLLTPFSRLSLNAQLEVLSHSPEYSWSLCAPFNPDLRRWRVLAARGALKCSPWRKAHAQALSPDAYGERFASLLRRRRPNAISDRLAGEIQESLIRDRLGAENQYPLLWSPKL